MAERVIERALYAADRGLGGEEGAGFGRIYEGHEFCHRRLPGPRALIEARGRAAAAGRSFSLVTPRLDEQGLARVGRLLAGLSPAGGDEVVVNDLGLLERLSGEAAWRGRIVVGRLLTKQRRGAAWGGGLPREEEARRCLRGSSLDSPRWVEWLHGRYGVRRFEIDNLLQGVDVGDLPPAVRLSVYHPYLLLTVTRLCPWSFDGRRWRTGDACDAPCREESLTMEPRAGGGTILAGGMAQFLVNPSEEIYSGPAVDRHVLQPRLPC